MTVLLTGPKAPKASPPAFQSTRRHVGASSYYRREMQPRRTLFVRQSSAQELPSTPPLLPEDATPSDGEVVPVVKALPPADERYQHFTKVLVVGATGGVGKAVTRQLADQGIPVRAFVRNAVRASSMLPSAEQKVDILEGDVYNFRDCQRAMQGCEAVICTTGPTDRWNPLSPFQVDFQGTQNLVAAAQQSGIKKFVFVSSIGADDILNPLNAFYGVLFWKKQGELALQRSGIDYTIIRPGGLLNEPRNGRGVGGIVGLRPDSFGLPPRRMAGAICRSDVAEGCVAALVEPSASNKVIEVIAQDTQPRRPWTEIFASVE